MEGAVIENVQVLSSKEEATVLKPETILVDQLRSKLGGQLVEIEQTVGEKVFNVVLCELPSE